jgi:hypothetical protein
MYWEVTKLAPTPHTKPTAVKEKKWGGIFFGRQTILFGRIIIFFGRKKILFFWQKIYSFWQKTHSFWQKHKMHYKPIQIDNNPV